MERITDKPPRWSFTSVGVVGLSIALSAIAIAVLPVAGAVCGAWLAWSPVVGARCGLWVFPALFEAGCGGLLGLAVGVGLALAVVCGCTELMGRVAPDDDQVPEAGWDYDDDWQAQVVLGDNPCPPV
jgi:hypothetical protein